MTTASDADQINIKNLVLEEPGQKTIDPEKLVSDQAWDKLKEMYQELFQRSNVSGRELAFGMFLRWAFPGKARELVSENFPDQQAYLARVLEQVKKPPTSNAVSLPYLQYLATARVLFPDITGQLPLNDSELNARFKMLEELTDDDELGFFPLFLFYSKVYAPTEFSLYPFDPKVEERFYQNVESARQSGRWGLFAVETAQARLLFPHHPIDLNQKDWDKILSDLARMETEVSTETEPESILFLPQVIWAIRVLQADKAELTEQGLKLTSKSQLDSASQLPPKVRSF